MVKTLLNSQTLPDLDGSRSEKPPSAAIPAGPIKDGFTPSATESPHNQVDPNVPEASLGKFTNATGQMNFVGSEHWEAILEDIAELKIDMERETPSITSQIVDFKPQILFGMNHVSRSEIMSSIPERPICDMLISRWFRTMVRLNFLNP